MPIDRDRVVGATLPETTTSWDDDDVILYHLGLGAGVPATDPSELEYTYEGDLKVLPTFATIPPFSVMTDLSGVEGLSFDPALVLHGEQAILLAGPIPTRGTVTNRGRIVEVFDKGKAALIIVEVESVDAGGVTLFTNRSSVFIRGEGGFGGPSGPPAANPAPDRDPDVVVESPTLEQQALLYRLSGDKNPLHADPAFAAMGGFDRPILHGLCSYGIVCKAVVDSVLEGDVAAVSGFGVRFAGTVVPGETITTSMWVEGGRIVVSAATKDRGTPVIANATLERKGVSP
jgi:acyl dehydratase